MLKITKGLKKKKKGKKSKKNKEEELFKPEELEAYRREHQQQQQQLAPGEEAVEGPATAESDEWRKFQALTAGVDTVLRKTQGDLDRIKSTSFFQRVAPPVRPPAPEDPAAQLESATRANEAAEKPAVPETLGVVAFSETESEEDGDDEDDIFDTSFVDAVASGEVKLAYIPESPVIDDAGKDDPFDTSIAERAILGPAFETKGKRLVPLGAAVEVLTGRVEQVTCAPRKLSVRQKQRQQDLLLGSFDFDTEAPVPGFSDEKPASQPHTSLLDDDSIPLDNVPIDLSGASLYPVPEPSLTAFGTSADPTHLFQDFDLAGEPGAQNEPEDDEFAQLAAESVARKPSFSTQVLLPGEAQPETSAEDHAFDAAFADEQSESPVEDDPFDTTFTENILPGRAELRLIENEILNADVVEPVPRVDEHIRQIIRSQVSINVITPTGERESITSLDRIDEACLNSLQLIHRDLLGGSNTDLSKIGEDPIVPSQPTIDDPLSGYSDPFDTSTVEQVTLPGQAELRFIEKEILGGVRIQRELSDPDFNPREESAEPPKVIHRPDLLAINNVKSVAFVLPTPGSQPDLLATGEQDNAKHTKPLTPYYVRENSLSEPSVPDDAVEDPFDTSFVSELAPGKAELKLIENEFIGKGCADLQRSLSDEDFDPRAETAVEPAVKPEAVRLVLPVQAIPKPDLLAADDEVSAKVLTPAVESTADLELSYSDPFDTSIASNILPGKTELKILENELIHQTQSQIKRNLTDPEFDPRNVLDEDEQLVCGDIQDLLDNATEQVAVKPLSPTGYPVTFDIGTDDEIDPFNTSVADNLGPGRTELKLLESELI